MTSLEKINRAALPAGIEYGTVQLEKVQQFQIVAAGTGIRVSSPSGTLYAWRIG
jgi:hypothetical protein